MDAFCADWVGAAVPPKEACPRRGPLLSHPRALQLNGGVLVISSGTTNIGVVFNVHYYGSPYKIPLNGIPVLEKEDRFLIAAVWGQKQQL